jgi:transposase
MERIPNRRYTKEFREEAVKLVQEGGLSVRETCERLSLPKSTMEQWIRASKRGKLGEVGKDQRPLSAVERELAEVKRELALAKQERDILKKRPRTLARSRCTVRGNQGVAALLHGGVAVSCAGSDDERVLCLGKEAVVPMAEGRGKIGGGDPGGASANAADLWSGASTARFAGEWR